MVQQCQFSSPLPVSIISFDSLCVPCTISFGQQRVYIEGSKVRLKSFQRTKINYHVQNGMEMTTCIRFGESQSKRHYLKIYEIITPHKTNKEIKSAGVKVASEQ